MKFRTSRAGLACAIYFLLHLAAQSSAALFEVAPGISLWYPPCGLALSLLVLLGPRYAPVVFLANFAAAWSTTGTTIWWFPIVYPGLITANYAGVAWIVRRVLGTKRLLPATTRETFVFAVTMAGAPIPLAFAGSAISTTIELSPHSDFFRSFMQWWVGDASGLLTVVPVAMVFVAPWLQNAPRLPQSAMMRSRLLGSIFLPGAILLGCLWAVFIFEPLLHYHAFYLCFLPLIWISLRQGLPGATVATLVIAMGSLIGLHLTGSSNSAFVSFLLFELSLAVTGLGLGSAVTRRNEAEQGLTASEARFDRVLSGAQLGLWDWNLTSQNVAYNQRCAEIFGHKLETFDPSVPAWEKLIHPADRDRVVHSLKAHLEGHSPLYEVEYRIQRADRHWRWLHSRGSIVERDTAQRPLRVAGTHSDVTDRKHAESEAHRLLEILEATTDFILAIDLDGRVLHANAAFLRLLGGVELAKVRERSLRDVFPPATHESLQREMIPFALASGTWHGESVLRDTRGQNVPVSLVVLVHRNVESDAVTLSFVMRDISRQKQTETEKIESERKMLQVQKSESLGMLAGGIAHDFNNLLTAMLGNANLARLDLPDDSPLHGPLSQIEHAADRAAELCQQMLAYAGRSPLAFADVDLSKIIEDTKQLLHVSMGKKTTVELDLERPLSLIRAAPSQMQQVVMNLALNASEALGDNGGTITLRTSARHFSATELREHYHATDLAEDDYVLMEISDTGCGMTPELVARIFEPFFTTKFTGHGLGLAAVMGIVKSHSGAIHVKSQPGHGSTFRLLFPALGVVDAEPVIEPVQAPGWRGSGKILVVDDEPNIRLIVALMVETFGFTALTACDGVEGVEQFKQHAESLTVVLLDLTMPRMDGEEALTEMHRIKPDVPVILMSGFSEKLTIERFGATRPAGFLAKPFDRKTVQARLQSVVQAERSMGSNS